MGQLQTRNVGNCKKNPLFKYFPDKENKVKKKNHVQNDAKAML